MKISKYLNSIKFLDYLRVMNYNLLQKGVVKQYINDFDGRSPHAHTGNHPKGRLKSGGKQVGTLP